jgi:tetratricopeptide (TPR) repeat protein
MKLADCYRLLGLKEGASYEDVKASYRRLARRYHPDVNPNSRQAEETFIRLTEAYHQLIDAMQPSVLKGRHTQQAQAKAQPPPPNSTATPSSSPASNGSVAPIRKRPTVGRDPNVSQTDQQLKEQVYELLERSLREQRFPRAIALIEGLAQRLPQDAEVRQWQAIAYQRWGRFLIQGQHYVKARIYLNKALRTDPRNRALWYEVDQDIRRLDGIEIL